MRKIDVLDRGYVRLVDHMGTDLTPVNAARTSFMKESKEMTEKDERLLKFLGEHGHSSPFRHAMLQFEVYAPLLVARQWWRYVIGSSHQDNMMAWNESSRRYVTEQVEFYVPSEWRSSPDDKKQGSGDPVEQEKANAATNALLWYAKMGEDLYNDAMKQGICAEQARLFLPAYGLYVRWYWTASLAGVAHLLSQRLAHDAQKEFQEYAKAIHELTSEAFPVSTSVLLS